MLAEPCHVAVNPSARARSGVVELILGGEGPIDGAQILDERVGLAADLVLTTTEVRGILSQLGGQDQLGEGAYLAAVDVDEDDTGIDIAVRFGPERRKDLPVAQIKSDLLARFALRPEAQVRVKLDQASVPTCAGPRGGHPGLRVEGLATGATRGPGHRHRGRRRPARACQFARDRGTLAVGRHLLGQRRRRASTASSTPVTTATPTTTRRPSTTSLSRRPSGGRVAARVRPGPGGRRRQTDVPLARGDRRQPAGPDRRAGSRRRPPGSSSGPASRSSGSRRASTTPAATTGSVRGSRFPSRPTTRVPSAPSPSSSGASSPREARASGPCATYPSRRFVQAGGLTVCHEGLCEYELVDLRADGRQAERPAAAAAGRRPPRARGLALTLLRATGMLSRLTMLNRPLPAGPIDALEGPQLQGPLTVRYAVAVGDLDGYALADDAFTDLPVVTSLGGGRLPLEASMLSVHRCRGERGPAGRRRVLEVRVFNPGGVPNNA